MILFNTKLKLYIMGIDKNQLYTTKEVAKLLKVSDLTIKRYIADKKIISFKFNGLRRIKGEDIAKLLGDESTAPIKEKHLEFYRETTAKHLNSVYHGDIMELLKKLPNNSVDMVFGDPDYNVGINYGDKNYTRDFDEYMNWYIELTRESMRVLKEDGNLFMMNYPKQNAHLRVKYLDNHFPLVFDNVWVYNSNVGHTPKRFTTAHRSILHVKKTENSKFYKEKVALPYKNPNDKRILNNLKNGSKGRMPYSWYYFNLVKNVSKEKTYHACQIPQKLTEMLIKASTMPNDVALILFGGSGAELEICKRLNRKFISAEIDPKYQEIIKDRLNNGYIQEKYRLPAYLKLRNKSNQTQEVLI
jgi:site-specific DNA-methyltransferase (adenine-specific)